MFRIRILFAGFLLLLQSHSLVFRLMLPIEKDITLVFPYIISIFKEKHIYRG
jgi:hypothetical protein